MFLFFFFSCVIRLKMICICLFMSFLFLVNKLWKKPVIGTNPCTESYRTVGTRLLFGESNSQVKTKTFALSLIKKAFYWCKNRNQTISTSKCYCITFIFLKSITLCCIDMSSLCFNRASLFNGWNSLLHIHSHIADIGKCSCILQPVIHRCSAVILEAINLRFFHLICNWFNIT